MWAFIFVVKSHSLKWVNRNMAVSNVYTTLNNLQNSLAMFMVCLKPSLPRLDLSTDHLCVFGQQTGQVIS